MWKFGGNIFQRKRENYRQGAYFSFSYFLNNYEVLWCTIAVVPKLSVSDQYRDSTFQLFRRSARKILFRNYWCLQAPLEIRSSNLVFLLQIVLKIAQVRKQLERVMSFALFFSSFAKGQRTKWTWKQAISWALVLMRMCLWWFLVKMETAGNWRWKIQKLIRISLKEATVISSASRAYSVWVSFFFSFSYMVFLSYLQFWNPSSVRFTCPGEWHPERNFCQRLTYGGLLGTCCKLTVAGNKIKLLQM